MRRPRAAGRDQALRLAARLALAAALVAGGAAPAAEVRPVAAADLASALEPYLAFRTHELIGWHPQRREVHVLRRSRSGVERLRVPEPGAAPLPLEEDAGEAALRALLPANETFTGGAWDARRERFAFIATAGEARGGTRTTLRLHETRRPGSARVLARFASDGWRALRFSPDGKRLVLLGPAGGASHVWVVHVASGAKRRVSARAPAGYAHPFFTPDGRALVLASDRGAPHARVVRLEIADGRERALAGGREVATIAAAPDARLAAFTTVEEGGHVLRLLDMARFEELPRPPLFAGVIGGLAWRRDATEVGFHISSARTAGDVFSYDPQANQLARWTNGNSAGVNIREFAEPRLARWTDSGGNARTLLHYHPPERFAGRRPVVVSLAFALGAARPGFIGAENYLVNELGLAVVRPGAGADAAPDLAALRAWIAAQPDLDPDRVALLRGPAGDAASLAAALEEIRAIP